MTCKDCIHYNVCVIVEHRVDEDEDHLSEFGCEDFINKNDVVEVVHGEWTELYRCSICGRYSLDCGRDYCSNCGAKMDGKKVE